ncbi:unnamed protein product [Prorocentrum cordatum]|uniref:EF-hand domain-containing protein n=1 Tax=Prorocentrum cordatum TaxID=2364126 RepID=A0ABN9X0J8_9DINO|nr:unnamed protein product [Polarella glacialis]
MLKNHDPGFMKTLREEWSGLGCVFRALVYTNTGVLCWADISRPSGWMSCVRGSIYTAFVVFATFGCLNILVCMFVMKSEGMIADLERLWSSEEAILSFSKSCSEKSAFTERARRTRRILQIRGADLAFHSGVLHMSTIHYTTPRVFFKMMDMNRNGELGMQELRRPVCCSRAR